MHGKIKRIKKDQYSALQEAEFGLGYLYRTLEEHINAFAGQNGCPYPVHEIALRMGDALRAKAAQVRAEHGYSQLVLEMRQDRARASKGTKATGSPFLAQDIHVVTRSRRTLSKEARKRIGEAQRKQWAKQRAKRKLSRKQLAAMRKNATLARQARLNTLKKAA